MRKIAWLPYFFKNFVKCLLGCLALTNAQLGIIAAFGLCSVFGLPYGPMHTLIMCLNIGLGVDNAFVIGKTMFGVKQSLVEFRSPMHCSFFLSLLLFLSHT